METGISYAKDEQQAQNYADEYWTDRTQIVKKTTSCGHGETICWDYFDGANVNPVERVIICESCYMEAALIDRV